jgi:hypothetical protein
MKMELEAVLRGKMADLGEADRMLSDAARSSDGEEGSGDDVEEERERRDATAGDTAGKGKGNGRARATAGNGHADGGGVGTRHASGGRATEDRTGITTSVPAKEQVERAEEMARQGRRV